MKKLAAVIAHWYAVRSPNLHQVIDAFRRGTMVPDEIIIWDNTGDLDPQYFPHASIITSPWNVGCKAKFLGALVSHGEYVFLTDNDVIVQRDTLAHMYETAIQYPSRAIWTLEGHVLGPDKSYRNSAYPTWERVSQLTHVDTLNCRTELIHRDTIKYLLQDILFDDSELAAHEDFLLAAAAKHHGYPCYVIPGNHEQGFTKIEEHGVGMSVTWGNAPKPEHYETRERLVKELF